MQPSRPVNLVDALFTAAKTGDCAAVAALLEASPSSLIDAQDCYGNSCLQLCVQNGDLDLTRLLLSMGAAVNLANSFGRTPLHKACWAIRPDEPTTLDIAVLLAAHGADVEARGSTNLQSKQVTPLDIVCSESDRYGSDHARPALTEEEKAPFRHKICAASVEYHARLRRDAAWARRRSLFNVLAGCGLRPLAVRRRACVLPLPQPEPEPRDWLFLLRQVFGHNLWEAGMLQLVVSFL